MSRSRVLLASAILALPQFAPADADTLSWSATVEGRAGYATNPFLDFNRNAGSGVLGLTIAPSLTLRNSKAQTDLNGSFNYDKYTTNYGHDYDFTIDLRRRQQLSPEVSINGEVGYFSLISALTSPYYNALIIDPGAVDQLAIGLRSRRVFGSAGITWTPSTRDQFSLSGNAEHDSFSRFGESYDYYGATGSYLRQIDGRTHLGVSLGLGHYNSSVAGSSTSVSPNLVVQRVLSARWNLNASVGAIVEDEHFRSGSHTSVTPGFNIGLCGKYTRWDVCFSGSRQTASSGLGGLRRQTQLGANGSYRLNEHSRVLGEASYGFSKQDDRLQQEFFATGTLRYASARLAYQRDLGRRFSVGGSGTYQNRSGGNIPDAHSYSATVNLTAHLGRPIT